MGERSRRRRAGVAPRRRGVEASRRRRRRRGVQLGLRGLLVGDPRHPGLDSLGRRKRPRRHVPHARRPALPRGCPLHVTLRVVRGFPRLRRKSLLAVVRACIAAGHKPGFSVCEFSLLPDHFHFVVEAQDRGTLARGLQGLKTRLARRLNRALSRRGTVFAERYHARPLRTPSEVRRALAYVLLNARRHAWQQGRTLPPRWIDPCSSGGTFSGWRQRLPRPPPEEPAVTRDAATWLLRAGWRRRGLVSVAEVPGA